MAWGLPVSSKVQVGPSKQPISMQPVWSTVELSWAERRGAERSVLPAKRNPRKALAGIKHGETHSSTQLWPLCPKPRQRSNLWDSDRRRETSILASNLKPFFSIFPPQRELRDYTRLSDSSICTFFFIYLFSQFFVCGKIFLALPSLPGFSPSPLFCASTSRLQALHLNTVCFKLVQLL